MLNVIIILCFHSKGLELMNCPCLNGGKCKHGEPTGYFCDCAEGYDGILCAGRFARGLNLRTVWIWGV